MLTKEEKAVNKYEKKFVKTSKNVDADLITAV